MRVLLFALFIAFAVASTVGDWKLVGTPTREKIVPVSVALTNRNTDWLHRTVEEVSNPQHPNWRKYVSKETLRSMMAPSKRAVHHVVSFLKENGMVHFEEFPTGDFLMTYWSVHDLERLFAVTMHEFRHAKTEQTIHRSLSPYHLPEALLSFVDVVGLISEFPEGHFGRTSKSAVPVKAQPDQAEESSTTCSSVMNWGYPASSDADLYSQVQIICCNGQPTTNLASPCSETGYTLTGFQTVVFSNQTGQAVIESTVAYSDVQSLCYADGTSITCALDFTSAQRVQPYLLYNLQVTGVFSGGLGQPSTFPVALVTSPFVVPQLFNKHYQVPEHWATLYPAANNSQSVVEFGHQYYSPADLSHFFGNMSLPDTPAKVVGRNDASQPGDEATLDIEWIMAVGVQIETVFWSVEIGYLLEWSQQLLSASQTPLVNSVSYGGNEISSPAVYRARVETEFEKLAAIGISIVVSSGDAGATNVGHGSTSCDVIYSQYPAASAFVTSVSATFFTPADIPMCSIAYYGKPVHCSDDHVGEIAVSADNGMDWTTGGGFSASIARPSWQADAVSNYITQHGDLLPPASAFNVSNRAYPDVSATGHNLLLILRDQMDIGDGTSASAPIFSGVLAMINQYLLSVGQAPVGFANPLLYQIAAESPAAFYDVTMGNNACGDVLHPPYVACCDDGYRSATGWDPVTGLGTPRFAPLLAAVQRLVHQQQAN